MLDREATKQSDSLINHDVGYLSDMMLDVCLTTSSA